MSEMFEQAIQGYFGNRKTLEYLDLASEPDSKTETELVNSIVDQPKKIEREAIQLTQQLEKKLQKVEVLIEQLHKQWSWMSYLTALKDEDYQESLAATELLGPPAEGFKNAEDVVQSSRAIQAAVKQNDCVIYLLVKTLKKLDSIETKVARIEESFLKTSKENLQFQETLEKLIQEVNRIKITEKGGTAPPAVIRKSYFFKNPQDIFDSEKAKLKYLI